MKHLQHDILTKVISPLTLTIALCLSSSANASQVESKFYGSLRLGADFVNSGSPDDAANGRDYLSRFGLNASVKVTDTLSGIAKIEYANGGTLFLDEIESTPMVLQVKLLRVLEERKIVRLGANENINLDVRVIAATKVDLLALCDQGLFRHDLYYRLNLVKVDIPPLRKRMEDVPLLFLHFARIASARYKKELIPLSREHKAKLLSYDWPGNVRELRNLAERYVLLGEAAAFSQTGQNSEHAIQSSMGLTQRVDFFEKFLIEEALANNEGCIKETMEELKLARKTLYDKMKKYDLERKSYQ